MTCVKWENRWFAKHYVDLWVDGVRVHVRLGEDKKICLLVLVGVTEDGDRKLLVVQPVIESQRTTAVSY